MKKAIMTITTLAIAITLASPALAAPSGWAQDQVTAAIAAGLVPQGLQGAYQQPITRAEFTALVVALYERVNGEIGGRSTFNDTDDENVQKAASIGVVGGTGGGNFSPDGRLTREQAATMLARLMGAMGHAPPTVPPTFRDVDEMSSWAAASVGAMQANGVMGGVGNNSFDPQGIYTREQSIVTAARVAPLVGLDITTAPAPVVPVVYSGKWAEASDFERRVFELVNEERVKAGVQPLLWDESLARAARNHSLDSVATQLNGNPHVGSDGSLPWDRAEREGFTGSNMSEVFVASSTAESAVQTWMSSPGHKAILLNPVLTHAGMGYAEAPSLEDNGQWTARANTMVFGRIA